MADIYTVLLDDAEAIVCTGLVDDHTETGEDYRDRLRDAAERKLPFVCANPDLVVDVLFQALLYLLQVLAGIGVME